jgi:hypothetical protein
VGRALAGAQRAGKLGPAFFEGIINAAKKQAAALDAYMHGAGGISARDRQRYAVDEYVQRSGAPPGTYAALETIAPLTPLLEAGAKVAVIGGAVLIVSLGAACVVATDGTCLAPATAFGEEALVVISDGQSLGGTVLDAVGIGEQWWSVSGVGPFRDGTLIPESFTLNVGEETFEVVPNATRHMAEYAISSGAGGFPFSSLASAVETAMSRGLTAGRNVVQVGDWELGIDMPDRVIFHAVYRPGGQ